MARRAGKSLLLHRVLMGAKKFEVVDHKDGNGLNCLRSNLRICTNQQNTCNARKNKSGVTSKYRGVSKTEDGTFVAYIKINYKNFRLGTFKNEEDAARIYDEAARLNFGEFARTNFENQNKQ